MNQLYFTQHVINFIPYIDWKLFEGNTHESNHEQELCDYNKTI